MLRRNLSEIAEWIDGELIDQGQAELQVNGISTDTRHIKPESLFIPIIGERFNAHKFVQEAVDQGAVASLWAKDQPNPPAGINLVFVDDTLIALQNLATAYLRSLNAKIIGITGSNGKTTTKDMMASVLSTTYKVQKTEGNFNNHIGMPLTILTLDEDTEMIVLEMGMSGFGEIELLSTIAEPDAAIITNIGESHLQDLGSRDNISKAKLEITSGMASGGTLVINGDEPLLTKKADSDRYRVITFGESEHCEFTAKEIVQELNQTSFLINGDTSKPYSISVPGKHNVMNALAVIAVANSFGIEEQAIQQGLKQIKMTGMRLEHVETENGLTIINDAYNASPTSMKAAVSLVEDLKGYAKKYVVLGDMLELGDDEINFHTLAGEAIDPLKINGVFTYGNLAMHINKGARRVFSEEQARHFESKEALISHLKAITEPEDLLLVKGSRGMKLEEVVEALRQESN
ncbi:UDP-N-acetylmuramoyl-tripeptide--D-alanyl-D-alanine ligase [Salisediminibacterium beveridgei]|uniref:UDP-N-acetylmuramoyl-tripeptide--D-alanyl-D-alanine ligase n=1 Tax=Salisediminibacterium beveridgei TaxID=632773 RepID=A0A1D7QVN7_9BACI|nr:UDP-N-acetylmuramoyl-tripeptide--D-alanyl-D-alanine ligase [Salisediminibacterium beveridgei]AOM83083.1 UDP-N-acetylmuramoylalanyl-D-glutamyl-2,6-diaminopimelate--D-alanyl-D-alanine ligase [Salisediminibacterium beveridgei]